MSSNSSTENNYFNTIEEHDQQHQQHVSITILDQSCPECHPIYDNSIPRAFDNWWYSWIVPIYKGETYTTFTLEYFLKLQDCSISRQPEEYQLQDYLILQLLTTIRYKDNCLVESLENIHSHLLLDWIKSDGFSDCNLFSETNTMTSRSDDSDYGDSSYDNYMHIIAGSDPSRDNTREFDYNVPNIDPYRAQSPPVTSGRQVHFGNNPSTQSGTSNNYTGPLLPATSLGTSSPFASILNSNSQSSLNYPPL
jgi:hypothetical protein